jgi:hypothetical protein
VGKNRLWLNRGIHHQAFEMASVKCFSLMYYFQPFFDQACAEVFAYPVAAAGHGRALSGENVLEIRFATQLLEIGIIDPAVTSRFIGKGCFLSLWLRKSDAQIARYLH